MLRRLNVRTRLVAVIAVPLVLLFAVAGPEILQRREDARAADRAAALAVDAQPSRRSPSEVRALLSRYRSGLQAGRGSDGAEEERS